MVLAAAFETAFTATGPPPVVAADRALLAALMATNFLGINTAAIMARPRYGFKPVVMSKQVVV